MATTHIPINGEHIPAEEAEVVELLVQMEAKRRSQQPRGSACRGAHAKAHGCVKAEFAVRDDIPAEFKVGIFKSARRFAAWIRFSNGSPLVKGDAEGDGRGMAIKLMGVEQSVSSTQDFLMINHPVFLVRNAADYLDFQQAVARGRPEKFFFPGLNPFKFRLHEFGIARKLKRARVTNPLNVRYWSMTPYAFGNAAMKFSARPAGTPSPFDETRGADFLRENLAEHLTAQSADFDFLVQLRTNPATMPIEDPTIEWNERESGFVPVARITIPPQQFDTPEQRAFCENLSFSPWHAIPEHRPLGGINRIRQPVYGTSSRIRHELNGQPLGEPR